MIVCDKCQKRNPRRRILVKDVQYDKSRGNGKQYDLCTVLPEGIQGCPGEPDVETRGHWCIR